MIGAELHHLKTSSAYYRRATKKRIESNSFGKADTEGRRGAQAIKILWRRWLKLNDEVFSLRWGEMAVVL